MANHKSAQKRIRQSRRIRLRNRHVRSSVRTVIKKFRTAVEAGDQEEIQTTLRAAESAVRRAATKGLLPKRRASRLVGRLAKQASTPTES